MTDCTAHADDYGTAAHLSAASALDTIPRLFQSIAEFNPSTLRGRLVDLASETTLEDICIVPLAPGPTSILLGIGT
jgi:hypothetical protein